MVLGPAVDSQGYETWSKVQAKGLSLRLVETSLRLKDTSHMDVQIRTRNNHLVNP